jgi:hypothetical protein
MESTSLNEFRRIKFTFKILFDLRQGLNFNLIV